MNSGHINAFFSCSFKDEDKSVNDYFKSLCEALRILCRNVSDGYAETPPDAARGMIGDARIVIAVIPRREKIVDDKWTMPSAVREEIAMAYAMKKPTLILIEDGVVQDGFFSNFGTFIVFKRDDLFEISFIKKVVSSLYEIRQQSSDQQTIFLDQDSVGFYAEKVSMLIEPERTDTKPIWRYSNYRKLVFTKDFDGQIKNSAWIDHLPEGVLEKIDHSNHVVGASRDDLRPTSHLIKDTPQQVIVALDFESRPQKDDWIEVEFGYSSPYLNCIEKKDATDEKKVFISGRQYDCVDGIIPIQSTRDLHVQVRFPSWYPVDTDSIFPFVGSYSRGVDYVVESEMKRCSISTSRFGASVQVDIKVESPLMRHVYGVAWNLL